jgi:excisionase family DNA binding protein
METFRQTTREFAVKIDLAKERYSSMNADELYTVDEIATRLRSSRASVYRLLQNGTLDSVKIGGARKVMHSQLLEFLEKCKKSNLVKSLEL